MDIMHNITPCIKEWLYSDTRAMDSKFPNQQKVFPKLAKRDFDKLFVGILYKLCTQLGEFRMFNMVLPHL